MTSPIATGGRYVGVSPIQARFVGIQRDPAGAHQRLTLADLGNRLLDELERPVVDPPGGALAEQEAAIHIGHGWNLTRSQTTAAQPTPGGRNHDWTSLRSASHTAVSLFRERRISRRFRVLAPQAFHLMEQPTGGVSAGLGSRPSSTASRAPRKKAAFWAGSSWSASGAPR